MAHTAQTIIDFARILSQDTATTNPACDSTSVCLPLLNDVLLRFEGDVDVKHKLVSATTSGLTFAANDTVKTTSVDVGELIAAFQSDSASVNTLQTPALALWTVREMLDKYSDTGSGTSVTGQAREFEAWAWEKVQEGADNTARSEKARVYVWPPLNRTRYLTLRDAPYNVLTALTGDGSYVDLNPRSMRLVARFLAWEMARLHTRDEAFLNQILAPIPKKVLEAYFESARKGGFNANSVQQTGYLNG